MKARDRKDLQELSKVRLKEATALLKLGLFDGACYLAGYSVECALKVAGLEVRFNQAGKDPDFRSNWDVVEAWTEESRYQRHPPESAQKLLRAIANRQHGVISWIKLQW